MSDKPPTRSGFCNLSWPTDVAWGAASHARCRKENCPCDCELGDHHSVNGPFKPRFYPGPEPTGEPPEPLGPEWEPLGATADGGPFVATDTRLPKNLMVLAPAEMSFEDMVLGLVNDDPRVMAVRVTSSPVVNPS